MAAGEFGAIGKDGHMAWKVATAMGEVGTEDGTQGRARGQRRNFCAKRIGLGREIWRDAELVVDGPGSAFASSTQPW